MRSKIKIFLVCLVLASVFLSGCLQSQPKTETTTPSIDVGIIIEERTGDLSNNWLLQKPGWYSPYTGTKVSRYTDTGINPLILRGVGLLLITEDPAPQLVVRSADAYYSVNPSIRRMSTVPRGYPTDGKRVYQIHVEYSLKNFVSGNLFTLKDGYFDVNDEIFYISHDPKGTLGYS